MNSAIFLRSFLPEVGAKASATAPATGDAARSSSSRLVVLFF
jgi:hypothetical protein